MKKIVNLVFLASILLLNAGCSSQVSDAANKLAKQQGASVMPAGLKTPGNYTLANGELLLGNAKYPAISYSGWRADQRIDANTPTVEQIKQDMKILSAMGIKLLRTYNTQGFKQSENMLQAIRELKQQDPDFEMYVMLGAWIASQGSDHSKGDLANNQLEMDKALEFANTYADIVKIIAVGNEAMVDWQVHFVPAKIILKWVNYVIAARDAGTIPKNILVTSSDNFAPWGGSDNYHNADLIDLVKAVDFVSMHTYPFHDTHYNAAFWKTQDNSSNKTDLELIDHAMDKAVKYAQAQYLLVQDYVHKISPNKPIHIGETGWATTDQSFYAATGSAAADEYKLKKYYLGLKQWTENAGITCFFFEGFDEPWKGNPDAPLGSEKSFGLFTVDGKAKFAIWDLVDQGTFEGLIRDGHNITKSFSGNKQAVLKTTNRPPKASPEAH